MDRLSAIEAFLAVADTGSFTRAAEQLGLSTPVLSRRIKQFEETLGVTLFRRSTRQVALSRDGELFYNHACDVVAAFDSAESALRHDADVPRGKVRISAPADFGRCRLTAELSELNRRYPTLEVDLLLNDRPVNPDQEGFDLVIRDDAEPAAGLGWWRMSPLRRVLCAAPEYLERSRPLRNPDDLLGHRCLHPALLSYGERWPFIREGRVRTVPIQAAFCSNSAAVLREAALQGVGVALLPTFLASEDILAGRLRLCLAEFRLEELWFYAVYASARFLPRRLSAVLRYLAARFPVADPSWDEQLRSRLPVVPWRPLPVQRPPPRRAE